MAQYLQAAPCHANRGSHLFQVHLFDCLAPQTFADSPVKVERRDAHLQRLLNLCLGLCKRNYAAIKAASPYSRCAIGIAVVIWHGKKNYFLSRFQQTRHIPEVCVGGISNFDIEPLRNQVCRQ